MGKLILKENTKIHIFPFEEIIFIEAINGKVNISLSTGLVLEQLKYTLKLIERKLLSNNAFFKIHRSYIVNMNYVRRIEKFNETSYYVIGHNFEIPISRRYVKPLLTTLEGTK